MTDVPFIVSARFRKVVQTAPYESEEAEISAQYAISETADAPAAISSGMSMVKTQVYIALGKAEGKLVAVSTQAKPAEEKKPVGRPSTKPKPETAETTQRLPDAPKEAEKPAETKADDFDFSDNPQPKVDISDAELQGACSEAAKLIGAPKVKDLFQKKYGAQRVSGVNKNERQNFLADLKSLVEEHKKQSE